MQLLAWNDALRTNIDVIDRQHRGLVDMVNATSERLTAEESLSAREVRLLLGYLKDYAEVHFSTEEALMTLCGLAPDYTDRHHDNHARFLAHVGDMLDDLGEDAVPDGKQLLGFLGDWLIEHIQGEDQGLARRLHAAHLAAVSTLADSRGGEAAEGAGTAFRFEDALTRSSEALYASEADVLSVIGSSAHPALIVSLDNSLLPATVLHVNAVAARSLGSTAAVLEGEPAAALFGEARSGKFPVIMAEVLVSGHYEGALECRSPGAGRMVMNARVSHLVVHCKMAILVILAPVPVAPPGHEAKGRAARGASVPPAAQTSGRTVLSRHPLFAELGPDELTSLEVASRLIGLQKGEVLFHKGDAPAGLYLVVTGQMSLAVSNQRGAEKVLAIIDKQEVFGEVEVFTGRPYPMLAQSLTPSVLLMIPTDALRRLQAGSLSFANAVVAHLAARLTQVIGEVEALTLHTAMERIVDHLLEHAGVNSHGILEAILPAQKQVVASYLDISPATLSRAFQQLTDAGMITMTRRYVTIPDPARLMRYRTLEASA